MKKKVLIKRKAKGKRKSKVKTANFEKVKFEHDDSDGRNQHAGNVSEQVTTTECSVIKKFGSDLVWNPLKRKYPRNVRDCHTKKAYSSKDSNKEPLRETYPVLN